MHFTSELNEHLEVYLKVRLEGHNFYYKKCMANTKMCDDLKTSRWI